MAVARRTFPPVVTGSTWSTLWRATRRAAETRRGSDGHDPRLTNGDAADLVAAWTRRVSPGTFGLWYQFAASAYGWNAGRRDVLNASARQRDALMSRVLSRELWDATARLAEEMDDANAEPRLEIEDGTFDDPVFQGSVKSCLLEDGAIADLAPRRRRRRAAVGDVVAGKIPLCAKPKLGCKPGFKLVEVSPGVFVCKNEKTGEVTQPSLQCDEVVFVDDPLTFASGELVKLAVIVVGAIILANVIATEGARRRRN